MNVTEEQLLHVVRSWIITFVDAACMHLTSSCFVCAQERAEHASLALGSALDLCSLLVRHGGVRGPDILSLLRKVVELGPSMDWCRLPIGQFLRTISTVRVDPMHHVRCHCSFVFSSFRNHSRILTTVSVWTLMHAGTAVFAAPGSLSLDV